MELNLSKLNTYYVTKNAPKKIYGKRHGGVGSSIQMTEDQAKHLLRSLQITKDKPGAENELGSADDKKSETGTPAKDPGKTKPKNSQDEKPLKA